MAHDVFVSYSQKDKATADAVVARLEQDGLRCWVASRDIVPGTNWGEAIVRAISSSRLLVLVLSDSSNRSRQVVREVERAVTEGVVILPFRVEDIDPTGAMAYFLATEHWLDALTPPLEQHLDRLATTAGLLLSGASPEDVPLDRPPPSVAAAGSTPWWRRPGIVAVAAVLLMATGAAVMIGLLGDDPTATDVATPDTQTGGPDAQADAADDTSAGTDEDADGHTTGLAASITLEQVGQFRPSDLRVPTDTTVPGLVHGFAVDGSVLALANGTDGVTRVAIGSPSTPRPMDTFGVYDVRDVAFTEGDIAALAGESATTVTVFPTDGSGGSSVDPKVLGGRALSNLAADGGFVYVTGWDYLGIIDATDPTAPELVFEWEPDGSSGNAADVEVVGDVGYVAAGWDGLYVFDLEDPSAPVLLSHWPSPDWIIDLAVVDDVAYVTLGESGVATVDVSDPAAPVLLGAADVPLFTSQLAVGHGHVFASQFGDAKLTGIAVVDVSDPTAPVHVDTVGQLQTVSDLEVVGEHLFVTEETQGLLVYEIGAR